MQILVHGTYAGRKLKMKQFQQSIDVHVPARIAYMQWTRFEELPRFLTGVHAVRKVGDSHLHWRSLVGGREREWDAVITEQTPDQRIAWQSTTGPEIAIAVSFQPLDETHTRVTMDLRHEESLGERLGDWLGFGGNDIEANLKIFKTMVEMRQEELSADVMSGGTGSGDHATDLRGDPGAHKTDDIASDVAPEPPAARVEQTPPEQIFAEQDQPEEGDAAEYEPTTVDQTSVAEEAPGNNADRHDSNNKTKDDG
jgi:uncharacterized membrane protein